MHDSPEAIEKIAGILRAPKEVLFKATEILSKFTGQTNVIREIVDHNSAEILEALDAIELTTDASAQEVHDGLISKMEADDLALYELFRRPDYSKPEAYKTVLGFAREVSQVSEGFFLKHEKAREFLTKEPPEKIMAALGYRNIKELLEKEDLLEIYSALRFLEGSDWLNKVFFRHYGSLKPSDFETRPVEARVISPQWVKPAEKFLTKKHHNLSHLKELGVIFIIPWTLGRAGETMRMFSLLVHYMHELEFYSKLFEKFARNPKTFTSHFISALRGDISEKRPPSEESWLIVQRYLAKDDENDWRLFWPHVNPEALHWQKAEEDLVRMGTRFKLPGLNWVGDYFKTEVGTKILVSFDLVDTAMSLVKKQAMKKYLYHHQEALWNKIFSSYFSREEVGKMIVSHWDDKVIHIRERIFL